MATNYGMPRHLIAKSLPSSAPTTMNPFSPIAIPEAIPEEQSLFENPLLLQTMLSAGAAMSSGEPIGPALDQVGQQSIRSQSYANLMKRMLEGGMEGGKFSVDNKGLTMTIPGSEILGMGTNPDEGVDFGFGGGGNKPNPFSAEALAGLEPEHIQAAISTGMKAAADRKAAVRQAKIDALDRRAAEADILYKTAQSIKAMQPKDERTNFQKDYEYAVAKGFEGTPAEWKSVSGEGMIEQYNLAVSQGETRDFTEWRIALAKAGATNIRMTPGDRALDVAKVEGNVYFRGKDWTKDLDKYLTSEKFYNDLLALGADFGDTEATRSLSVNWIEGRIRSMGGQWDKPNVAKNSDGSYTVTWKVYWKDGKTSEVSHVFR